MEFWQTIVATMVGGAITITATVITSNYQRSLDRGKRKLEKLEKAYELLSRIEHIYRMAWSSDLASLNSGVYEDKYRIKEKVPFEDLEFLINFYAHELKNDVEILVSISREKFQKLSSCVADNKINNEGEKSNLQAELNNAYFEIKEHVSIIQGKIANNAEKYI